MAYARAMVGRRIVGADGRKWRVYRRWLPWQPRRRGRFGEALDALRAPDLGFEFLDGPGGVVVSILVFVAFVLVVVFVLPVVLTALEILLVFVLLPLFVVARLVLRKPWIVVARTAGPPPEERTVAVRGLRASGSEIDRIVQQIRREG